MILVRVTETRAQAVAKWRAVDEVWLDHTVLRAEDLGWLAPARKLTMWAVKVPDAFVSALPKLEWLDVRARRCSRALADPKEVSREVVRLSAGHHARARGLVVQMETFVGGEVVDLADGFLLGGNTNAVHEVEGVTDALGNGFIATTLRDVVEGTEVPCLAVVKVGEAALNEGADVVHCCVRVKMGLH